MLTTDYGTPILVGHTELSLVPADTMQCQCSLIKYLQSHQYSIRSAVISLASCVDKLALSAVELPRISVMCIHNL